MLGYVMPLGNNTTRTRKVSFDVKGKSTIRGNNPEENQFLTIAAALPILPGAPIPPKLSKRSYNSLSSAGTQFEIEHGETEGCDMVTLQWTGETRTIVASRTLAEREKNPDRICLDRRGLTTFPNVIGEPKLRLMSLQHNLLTKIESFNFSQLTKLVFLDLYDNQIEKVCNLGLLENLRVLLIGKNRIKKIEGLKQLFKLEVLDLHGNQIQQVTGLEDLLLLKVLNLAGNNIKTIGCNDFQGLTALKELNLRRNKLKKLLGFGETPQLQKLYLSNNDIHKIEDMSSLAKALQIKEITIDGNPVTLNTDYISFLVSYLPNLQLLSTMQISEQIRRTAMAWRFSKEQSNSAFLDLSAQVCMNVRREEVISNAKTNWELLRSRTKVSHNSNKATNNDTSNNTNVLRIQSSNKYHAINPKSLDKAKIKGFGSLTSINENVEARKIHIKKRSNSSDNLFKIEDTSKSYPLEFKLPPILGSIVDSLTSNKFEDRLSKDDKENICKTKILGDIENTSDSESDSSESHESLKSGLRCHLFTPNNCNLSTEYDKSTICKKFTVAKDVVTTENFNNEDNESHIYDKTTFTTTQKSLKYNTINENKRLVQNMKVFNNQDGQSDCQSKSTINSSGYCSLSSKSSLDSCKSLLSDSSTSSISKNAVHKSHEFDKDKNRIKSAQAKKVVYYKSNRAATARAKFRALAPPSPPPQQVPPKEREQGGDYLIEIVGRCLNIYGQGALRFIDKTWDISKAQDVNVVKFNYVQFNDVAKVLSKLKNRFPHAEHFTFKETNINLLGQLNALAEVQGLTSIQIDTGNPVVSKNWKMYAIFRLAHWGLAMINGKEITAEEIELANQEYAGLIDIVMCSLPDSLLQPLLQRLHLEKVQKQNGQQITAKQFLFNCDPALRSVVAKEALQWRKGNVTQEDLIWRHKGKMHFLNLINLTINAIQKLQFLEKQWPCVLYEIIYNTLSDFSEMDVYMKHCSKTLESNK
ncbi:Leucine-rich repeat-containing protein 49 [Camponotus floridanus]|uniref:Dynein axonemal assembly factor 1 homolog n=1 Tax=Camponotus floridanus TaxID=104421 RepID=E2A5G2_CAMFO|nr:leucine-rich repeat-containing protein 49 [Camponotus floridanus]EFN71327.1 Leucine-rich repeat-containing protein 49 [Camponotus floridanus]